MTAPPGNRSGPRLKRRHAAARSRIAAGVLSVAAFVGIGTGMAVHAAANVATSATTDAGSSSSSTTSSSSTQRPSTSIQPATSGTTGSSQVPDTMTSGS